MNRAAAQTEPDTSQSVTIRLLRRAFRRYLISRGDAAVPGRRPEGLLDIQIPPVPDGKAPAYRILQFSHELVDCVAHLFEFLPGEGRERLLTQIPEALLMGKDLLRAVVSGPRFIHEEGPGAGQTFLEVGGQFPPRAAVHPGWTVLQERPHPAGGVGDLDEDIEAAGEGTKIESRRLRFHVRFRMDPPHLAEQGQGVSAEEIDDGVVDGVVVRHLPEFSRRLCDLIGQGAGAEHIRRIDAHLMEEKMIEVVEMGHVPHAFGEIGPEGRPEFGLLEDVHKLKLLEAVQ